jgi:NAD(P)-dependent dehydrogenase (short-subunit alcohol dehydrogenase family)
MEVNGSVTLITGAASGLGKGTAEFLAVRGGRVAVLDLPGSKGAEVAASIGSAAIFVPVDVTNADQVECAVEEVVSTFGQIDVAVNCAAIAPRGRIVNRARRRYPLEDFRRTIDINLTGTYDICRHAAWHMAGNEEREDGERGVIVNVTSIGGLEGSTTQTAYAASKSAIAGLTLPMARDLSHWGIRVVTISPGAMDTPILNDSPPEYWEVIKKTPLFPRRLGRPDEFGRLVAVIMENVLLNGEVIRLDTGSRAPV